MKIRVLALACALAAAVLPARALAAGCDGALSVPPQPKLGWPGGIAFVGSSPEAGAWGAGARPDPKDPSGFVAVSERWDGAQWAKVPMAHPRSFEPRGFAVLGDRVFAGGRHSLANGGDAGSMIQMWDGVQWSVAPTPAIVAKTATVMNAVGGSAADDVWAAGRSIINGAATLVVLHFDGITWSRVAAPMPFTLPADGDIRVESIAASAADDAWIVGAGFPNGEQSFAIHWDGKAWSVHNPVVTDVPDNNGLYDVASANGVTWAVGFADTKALIIRWNGTSWGRLQRPPTGFSTNEYFAVAVGPRVLIGGEAYDGFPPDPHLAYFERVPGGWVALSAPVDGIGDLSIAPDGQILATGAQGFGNPSRILMGCLS